MAIGNKTEIIPLNVYQNDFTVANICYHLLTYETYDIMPHNFLMVQPQSFNKLKTMVVNKIIMVFF